MPDEQVQTPPNGAPTQPTQTNEQMIPKSRFDERGSKIAQLEGELAQLRPKAQGYDAVQSQVAEWQSKAHQAEASLSYFKAAAPHGFVAGEEVDHLAQAYQQSQAGVAQNQRVAFDAWLARGVQDPNSLGLVTGTFVQARLASRGSAAGSQPASPPATAATAPTPSPGQPVSTPATTPAAPIPAANAGVRPAPGPAPMSADDVAQLVKDPKKFKAWREANPDAYTHLVRRGR